MSFPIPLNFEQSHVHDSALSQRELIHWLSSNKNKLSPVSRPFL